MGLVIGITGGVASGKTVVLEMFRELGAETISADKIAHELLSTDSGVISEISENWPEVIDVDGSVSRKRLGEIVFSDESERRKLNDIMHPRIISALEERIRCYRNNENSAEVLAAEIPLLIECNLTGLVDKVLVVVSEQEEQISRLRIRGLETEEAVKRIMSQMPLEDKKAFADWVIQNSGSIDDTRIQVEKVWQEAVRLSRNNK
jgi:dephospho-CoA kinase